MTVRPHNEAPMLPAVAALAAGIAAASWRMLPVWFCAVAVAVCVSSAAACNVTRRRNGAVGALLAAALFLGWALAGMQRYADPVPDGEIAGEAEIASLPSPTRHGRLRADARLLSVRDGDGRWRLTRGQLTVYTDSSTRLTPGEHVVWRGRIRRFDTSHGYGRLMVRRGYAGSLQLSPHDIIDIRPSGNQALHDRAAGRLARLPLSDRSLAVTEAMSIGERSQLDPALRSRWARAGMAHLLALSGLHVGIVFLLVNALLWWLPLVSRGHVLRHVAATAMLWIYVVAAGMPPSAVRAAVMFTLLQLSLSASARYSSLNALACAAFICLCFDADLLFDAGFQLSYISVAAIIAWGLPLCRRLHLHRDRHPRGMAARAENLAAAVANLVIDTFIIGLAAAVATMPLISYLFGVVPLAGALAGGAALLPAAVTVVAGAVWIVIPWGTAAPVFGGVTAFATGLLDSLAGFISSVPWAAAELRLTAWQTVAAYVLMAVATLLARTAGRRRSAESEI